MTGFSDVISFWFEEHDHEDWFGGKSEFDDALRARFEDLHPRVAAGETWDWRSHPDGRLAEILVLDQFSRQLFRDDARSYAHDGMALVLAQEMVAQGLDQKLDSESKRLFVYMPYMHSESLKVHEEAVRLFTALGNENNLKFEMMHLEIIQRFGRYPKRNAVLGRASTQEELDYIAERDGQFF